MTLHALSVLKALAAKPVYFEDVFTAGSPAPLTLVACYDLHADGLAFLSGIPLGRPAVAHITFEGRRYLSRL